jgi:hypothetical protein
MKRTIAEGAPVTEARRTFVEIYGSALVTVNYLRLTVVLLVLVSLGLVVLNLRTQRLHAELKPLVIRIDEVGRAEALRYDALTYTPRGQAPELKYFLVQFVTKHYGRMRASARAAYAESLLLLDAPRAESLMAAEQRDSLIDTFLGDASDEIEIRVTNVSFQEFTPPRFRAAVDFQKVFHPVSGGAGKAPETYVAHITFQLRDQVPNALIPVNPLGLTITDVRLDQAFQ